MTADVAKRSVPAADGGGHGASRFATLRGCDSIIKRWRLLLNPSYALPSFNEIAMINGMHAIIYSRDAEADRAFIRDVLGFASVDAGGGWLIFALPPAE